MGKHVLCFTSLPPLPRFPPPLWLTSPYLTALPSCDPARRRFPPLVARPIPRRTFYSGWPRPLSSRRPRDGGLRQAEVTYKPASCLGPKSAPAAALSSLSLCAPPPPPPPLVWAGMGGLLNQMEKKGSLDGSRKKGGGGWGIFFSSPGAKGNNSSFYGVVKN